MIILLCTSLIADEYSLEYTSQYEECCIDNLPVAGEFPGWISGTLVRNGPARFEAGGERVAHWFDGLAMLEGFHFENGCVSYVNRFLRTDPYRIMVEEGSIDFIGFGNERKEEEPDQNRTHLHNANVNVAQYGSHFVALTEVPQPVEFDIKSFETVGALSYEDDLPQSQVFESAHPEIDSVTGDQYNFLIKFGPQSFYTIYRISAGSVTREVISEIPTKFPAYMHSFSLTEKYIVLVEHPQRIDLRALMENPHQPFVKLFRWKPELGTVFHVVDKLSGEEIAVLSGPSVFSWHHINAYEKEGKVVLDLALSDPPVGSCEENQGVARFILDLGTRQVTFEKVSSLPFEMPWIPEELNGKPYRYAYGIDEKHGILKVDMKEKQELAWRVPGCYPSEPIFIKNPNSGNEDSGVLLSLVLDEYAGSSFLVCLDAKTLKELARAMLPHHIPRGLHGQFFKT